MAYKTAGKRALVSKGKKPYKKQPNRRTIYGSAASQLWQDVNSLRQLINVEFKSIDFGSSGTATTAGTFLLLNGCAEGSDFSNRDGRSIRVKSNEIRMSWNATATSVNAFCRMIVFVDQQPNGAAPALTDLLISGASSIHLAPRNLNNRKRFQILKDKCFPMNLLSLPNNHVMYKLYKKHDFHTTYNAGNAGTIADIQTNSLYCLVLSDQTGASAPGYIAQFRTRFIDN